MINPEVIFSEVCAKGTTIFMSTHTLEIAEEMCDRIGIIQDGTIVDIGTVKELRERTGSDGNKLESIFFKLTGGDENSELLKSLRF